MKGIGRNQPCPCGSGKKYKRCCADEPRRTKSQRATWMLIGLLLAALAGWVVAARAPRSGASPSRVWSPEHGHWHQLGGASTGSGRIPAASPPGPAPSGKVWSYEHGHWHDAR